MTIAYVKRAGIDGMAAFDVVVMGDNVGEVVALLRFDKWTSKWVLLHSTGLIEKFDSILEARLGASRVYG